MSEKEKEKTFVPDPGTCVPWRVKAEEIGEFPGNEEIVKKHWEALDGFANAFIWFWVQR